MSDLLCLGAVLAVSAIVLATGPASEPAPPQPDVLKTLRPGHPRLILLADDLERIRAMIRQHEQPRQWLEDLRKRAEELLDRPPVRYELIGPRLLNVSRSAVDRIYTLGLLYRLDGERRFADRAIAELLAICAFEDWHPDHFLDTAEMTHAAAIGYDWLYELLTAEQRKAVREAIISKGIAPAVEGYRGSRYGWWAKVKHNWNQVCNGGIGIGALAIADEDPKTAAYVLGQARASLPLAIAEYGPDGGCAEGPGYWHYATSYTVYFLAALESALGTDWGLSRIAGFDRAGDFRMYFPGPIDLTFNYADAGERAGSAPEMFWLARRFDKPIYAWHQRQHAGKGSPADLIWFDPRGQDPKASRLALDARFAGTDTVFLRGAWQDRDAVFVGFKGGDNRANHSHLDLGTFVLDALGQRWALDLGGDDYNMPGYFGKERFTYYRLGTAGHNTLVVNGANQDPAAKADIVAFESRPGRAFAVADLSAAYSPAARRVRRGIALLDRRHVLVQDDIDAERPIEVTWAMHTKAAIEVDGQRATLMLGDAHLRAEVLEPAGAKFEVESAERPKPENRNEGVRKLLIRLPKKAGAIRLVVLLNPYRGQAPQAQPKVRSLDDVQALPR